MRDIREEEEDFTTIQEISSTSTTNYTSMASSNSTSSSSSSWSRFKDPRIVRVSRAFGGKDRHSKVCTVRGLRDRRVRLSVPTAIQLYDLQDRLGLNQPSKVVDWLLNVAKHEIDELPPLQFPVGRFSQNPHQNPAFLEFGGSQSDKQDLKISGNTVNWDDPMKYSKSDVFWGKSKDVSGGKSGHRDGNWPGNQEERQLNLENQGAFVVSAANNILSRPNPSSLPIFLDSTAYNNQVFRWDPSNLTLSQPSDQAREDFHNIGLVPMAGSHQILVHQPGMSTHESHYFPSSNSEFDPKQLNFQTSQLSVSPITSTADDSHTAKPIRPSHFGVTANLLPSQNNAEHN